MADTVKFKNPETAKKYECTLEKDNSVIVLQAKDANGKPAPYRGPVSKATPEACAQMISEGIEFIKEKAAAKPAAN